VDITLVAEPKVHAPLSARARVEYRFQGGAVLRLVGILILPVIFGERLKPIPIDSVFLWMC